MITELAQIKIFALKVQEPGGAALIFPKSSRNQKLKKILLNKNLLLPLTSGVEIFLGCTIFEFGFFCLRKLTNNWYKKQKMLQNEFYQKSD